MYYDIIRLISKRRIKMEHAAGMPLNTSAPIMTRSQAYKVLGIHPDAEKTEIKKKYHLLMHRVHPDTDAFDTECYAYTAQEINEAYAILCKKETADHGARSRNTGSAKAAKKQPPKWDAPVNEHAYTERDVYHYAEDYDGTTIGTFVIATGKFIWNTQEDFPLFLKSMFACSKKLLDQANREKKSAGPSSEKLAIQAELTYLLAQQFIDASETLKVLVTPESSGHADIFFIPSMLELLPAAPKLFTGMTLYPVSIRRHRLFLKTRSGQEAGYLSFRDDRLYYIVIPLLEQKRAQVKIEISQKQDRSGIRSTDKYKNLDFWLKIPEDSAGTFPESINLQIDALLKRYINAPNRM